MTASRVAAMIAAGLVIALAVLSPLTAGAVEPDEMLANPALEARARAISRGLRCLVCQNESIDESDADLARDLRRLVRARIAAGDTDQQVRDYIVSRYGDFVLLKPPFQPDTYALWLGPPAILAAAGGALLVFYRRRRANAGTVAAAASAPLSPAAVLTAEEEARLARLLERDGGR